MQPGSLYNLSTDYCSAHAWGRQRAHPNTYETYACPSSAVILSKATSAEELWLEY